MERNGTLQKLDKHDRCSLARKLLYKCHLGDTVLYGVALAVALFLPGVAFPAPAEPIVVVLSWDGVRHDYPSRVSLPGLERMAREGARAARLVPGWPSTTFPGHVSMATGTYADRHGIVDNRFYDRERGLYSYSGDASWLNAEPLWVAAERQGVPAATYFWVGSESDWRGQSARYRIAPFDGGRLESLKAQQILAWLGLSEEEQPRLIMSYWAGADTEGHRYGPDSRRIDAALVKQDFQLERLLDGIGELGLWPRTTVIVVSDHGMTASRAGLDLAGAFERAGIPARVLGGAVAHVFVERPRDHAAAGALAADFIAEACPGATLHEGSALPEGLRLAHPTRTGDWVLLGVPPCSFASTPGLDGLVTRMLSTLGWDFGSHGYDPALADMGGIFYALGRGVPRGATLDPVRQIDLAATVSALLGIQPPLQSEGVALW